MLLDEVLRYYLSDVFYDIETRDVLNMSRSVSYTTLAKAMKLGNLTFKYSIAYPCRLFEVLDYVFTIICAIQ